MAKRGAPVPRPTKASEYELVFRDASAERGWRDLKATAKNALADAWDYLTAHPTKYDEARCYQLKGKLATTPVDRRALSQWQYKVTNSARIWYAVDAAGSGLKSPGRVVVTRVSTAHPNETDSSKNFR